jgi:iron complex outermembrane receptor protein
MKIGTNRPHALCSWCWSASPLSASLLIIATAALGYLDALAQTGKTDLTALSLDELATVKILTVYGASKHEQLISEAPSAITVVTKDEIQKSGYRTLGEVLNGVRGFYLTSDRSYSYIGVRGFSLPGDYSGRLLVCIDGHRVNDPIYDQALNGMDFPLDVDLIDHVEVIRGPESSLYGNNAMLGVINVITRRGRDFDGAEASGSYGSYDTWTGRLSYGNRFTNGVELALSGSYLSSAGHQSLFYPEFVAVNGGQAEGLNDSQTGSGFASISYRDFSLEGGYVKSDRSVPTAPFGSAFNVPGNTITDEHAFAEFKFQHQFEHDWGLLARLYYDHTRYDGDYPYSEFPIGNPLYPGQITLNTDYANSESLGGEIQLNKVLFEKHRLTAGVDYRHDFRLRQLNYDHGGQTIVDSNPSADTVGLYGQDEYRILNNLILTLDLRYDHYSLFGGTFSPRASLVYSPWSSSTFKLVYGEAHRAPNAFELYYTFPGYTNNGTLKAERSRSCGLDFEQKLGTHLSIVSSVFYYQLDDLISFQVANANYTFGNIANATCLGAEAGLEGRWSNGWRANLGYTYADAREANTDQWLPNSPHHLVKFNLTAPLWREKVFANLELLGMSDRRTGQDTTVSGYLLANLTLLTRNLVKNLEFSASIYNLFDTKYSDPVSSDYIQAAIEQNGRTFRVKLTYRF